MAVTRIKNNQITDSTITYQKIASGTLVGSNFNANLTLNSNVAIIGNLQVTGNTTTVNSIDTLIGDSLIVLNSGFIGTPVYDVGLVFNRSLGTLDNYGGVNAALVWSESDGAFIAVLTTETGATQGTINRKFKANLIAGNITVANAITAERATITTLNTTNLTTSSYSATGNIVAGSGTDSSSYVTGALVVPGGGGVGITGKLNVQGESGFLGNITAGNIILSGNINVPVGGTFSNTAVFFGNAGGIGALYAGASGYTALDHTVFQMTGNIDNYVQVNFQNVNTGALASTDYVATADNGSNEEGYINFGINGSGFNDPEYPDFFPNDGYLIHNGVGTNGNLLIISELPGTAIKFRIGGYDGANAKATITSTGLRVNTTTSSTSLTSGALIVDGGLGVNGNIHAAAINNTPIGNTIPSTGSFTTITATDAVFTNFNIGNITITGGNANVTYSAAETLTAANLNSTDGNILTLVTGNVSTANAVISGGYISGLANVSATYGTFTNFYSGNITGVFTEASLTGNVPTANIAFTQYVTTSTAATEQFVTFVNTATGNLQSQTGTNLKYIPSTGNLSATVFTGNVTGASAIVTTVNTANAYVTGNTTILGNANVAYTVYAANIVTTGSGSGNISGVNYVLANSVITTGNVQGSWFVGNITGTSANIVTLAVGNLTVSAPFDLTTINLVSGNILTLVAANLSSSNTRISSGYADNFQIGANSAATGAFTTLTSNGSTTFTSADQSDNSSTGAVVVTGGVGIGANLNVAGNAVIQGNLTVQGDITSLNVATLDVEDLNITVAKGAINPAAANGAGLTVDGAGATLTYTNSNDSWNFNKNLNLPSIESVTANITNGNVTTLYTGNLSTANARITGGNIAIGTGTGTSYVQADHVEGYYGFFGNLTTDDITAVAGNVILYTVQTGNLRVTGGYADSFPIGANSAATGAFTTLSATGVTTLGANVNIAGNANVAYTVYAANIVTTGSGSGNISGANYILANSVITTGNTSASWFLGNIAGSSAVFTDLTTTNATFTTLSVPTVTLLTVNATNGNISTLYAGNLSTANARITGGYADNFPIGANTASSGRFTTLTTTGEAKFPTLNVTANVYLAPQDGVATVTVNPLVIGTIDNMSIGQSGAANVYASGLRATSSLWAAPASGTVWLRGGTGGISGINNIPIGAYTPAAGTFTTAESQTLNVTNGNVTTLVATNFSSGNILLSGVVLSEGNIVANATTASTNTVTGALVVRGGAGIGGAAIIGGNVVAASGTSSADTTTGALVVVGGMGVSGAIYAGSIQNTPIGSTTVSTGAFSTLTASGTIIASGNIVAAATTPSTSNVTGALVVTGGVGVSGNLHLGGNLIITGAINSAGNIVINSNKSAATDFIISGVNESTLLYALADSVYDQVSIGGNLSQATVSQGAKLQINSTDSMILPAGTTSQRPSAQGYTDVDGMLRYNSTLKDVEYYSDGSWRTPGATFTIITQRTFQSETGDVYGNVDGSNYIFTLSNTSTTNGTLVSINGVVQIPSVAYTVAGAVLTFTEPPAIGDIVDTRVLTTTTTISSFASANGYNQVQIDNNYVSVYTGNLLLGSSENWRFDTWGDFYPVTTANIGAPNRRVDYIFASNINISGGTLTGAAVSSGSLDATVIGGNIAAPGSFTTLNANGLFTTNSAIATDDFNGYYVAPSSTDKIASFDKTVYRSGKFFIQLGDDGTSEYQAAEVIVVHDGSVASIETYGVTFTGAANLATFSANVVSNTVNLNASSAGANLKAKVTPTLMKL